MFVQKKFPNNYAWPGVTAMMYNVHLDRFFDVGNTLIKEEYMNKITDIGFEWKKHSSSEWQTQTIVPDSDGTTTFDIIYYINNSNLYSYENCMFKGYPYSSNFDYVVYPIRVIIKNLDSNTSYDLKSYYVCDGIKYFYNEQTISTLDGVCNLDFEEATYTSSTEGKNLDKEELEQRLSNAEEIVKEIFHMFYGNLDINIDISISANTEYAGAASGTHIDLNYNAIMREQEYLLSVLIHELGHLLMVESNFYEDFEDRKIKIMEFATNAPFATWKWMSSHNYPIISSEVYDYMDNCVVVAAYELAKF